MQNNVEKQLKTFQEQLSKARKDLESIKSSLTDEEYKTALEAIEKPQKLLNSKDQFHTVDEVYTYLKSMGL